MPGTGPHGLAAGEGLDGGAIAVARDATPLFDVAPLAELVIVVPDGGIVNTVAGSGLRPPGLSAVEPSAIPGEPVAASVPFAVGEEAEAAAVELLPAVGHVPPAPAPPSNNAEGSDTPVVRAAAPPQAELLPVIALCGTAVAIIGLTPGTASCVAPSGIPTGGTCVAGPMPSGEVIPSGDVVPIGGSVVCA